MSSLDKNGKPGYLVIIPAYNEESLIIKCLDAIYNTSQYLDDYRLEEIVVCINGCTDKTEDLVKSWDKANIKIIHSSHGYVAAINKLFRYARKTHPNSIVVKTDADGQLKKDALRQMFTQLDKHNNLVVVGGHPTPLPSTSKGAYGRFMSELLSVRSRAPEAEVATSDVSEYHNLALSDPINGIDRREQRLKIYFHGRLWCIRRANLLPLLPKDVIGDDVYLAVWLFHKYGKDSVRLNYNAIVYFYPNDTLRRHWKVYRRIHEDRRIVFSMPHFLPFYKSHIVKLDWRYILGKCSAKEITYFALYQCIIKVENLSYRFLSYKPSHWIYSRKES